jgi:hypothetical protein
MAEALLPRLADWTTTSALCEPGVRREDVNGALRALLEQGRVERREGPPAQWRRVQLRSAEALLPLLADWTPQHALGDAHGALQQLLAERRVEVRDGPEWRQRLCGTHCVVDLGNVHDCLRPLLPHAAAGLLTVAAYADMAYNGFGVCPPVAGRNVSVFQADTSDKNSADVQMIFDIALLSSDRRTRRPDEPLHIIVASKDLGFRSLQRLVERHDAHRLTFVTNWSALRLYIE